MLVLNRKKNESIVVNDNITITVVEIRGDKVRLGIVCPRETVVFRQEIYAALHGLPEPQYPPRPTEEQPFVAALKEQPGDLTTRLVFCDWLQERGDPLGEYLRNQCLLAETTLDTARREELWARQHQLWALHGPAWTATLPVAVWAGL